MTQLSIHTDDDRKKQKLDALLKQALDREATLLRTAIEKTRTHLSVFEQKYSLSSEDFFQRYQAGHTVDSDDVVDWAGEYQIYLSLLEQANTLQDIEVCK